MPYSMKRSTKRFSNSTKNSTYTKKRPARLTSGKTTYRKSKKVAKRIQPVSELKLQSLKPLDNFVPSPIDLQGGNNQGVYEINKVFGPSISEWDRFNPLGGFEWPLGTNSEQRIGKYMYLRNTMLKLQFQANASSGPVVTPIRLRLIIFKMRRSHVPSGVIKDPSTSLFLATNGQEFGTKNLGLGVMDWNTSLTNKRNYIIVKDTSFILQPTLVKPQGQDFVGQGVRYPQQKNININLGHYEKAVFDNASNLPRDANYQYGITCISTAIAGNSQSRDWTMSLRGTTSCYDN